MATTKVEVGSRNRARCGRCGARRVLYKDSSVCRGCHNDVLALLDVHAQHVRLAHASREAAMRKLQQEKRSARKLGIISG